MVPEEYQCAVKGCTRLRTWLVEPKCLAARRKHTHYTCQDHVGTVMSIRRGWYTVTPYDAPEEIRRMKE